MGVPEDMNFKLFPSIRLRFWQGNALASAEQPPVAAPLGWEAVTLRWDGGMLGCWKMFHLEFAIGPESLESFFSQSFIDDLAGHSSRYTQVIFNMEAGKFHPNTP